jgi:hypothetical protein
MICFICGEDKPSKKMFSNDVCSDCATSILWTEEIPPNVEDNFF